MKGAFYALLAALLFGASTPLAKSLLPQMTPLMLAGLLYLGSGVGLGVFALIRSRSRRLRSKEAALTRADWPWLAGAIACHRRSRRTGAAYVGTRGDTCGKPLALAES